MTEFNYKEIIDYVDGTRDLHFEEARDWAYSHGTTFEELLDKRALPKRYFQIGPEPLPPTKEQVSETRRSLYIMQKDPLTCQIQALRDEEQTEEIIAEIESLKVERAEVVAKIKEENPYPTETKASEVVDDSQMEQLELPLYV